jgi:hypothetical protein
MISTHEEVGVGASLVGGDVDGRRDHGVHDGLRSVGGRVEREKERETLVRVDKVGG